MGKPTGFMEYDRCEAASVEPKERIKNFISDECHCGSIEIGPC